MRYPKVLTEDETVDLALGGRSLARYGDGELRLAIGGRSISQVADKKLAVELCNILARERAVLPCIPSLKGPQVSNWRKYASGTYVNLYRLKCYGAAFITRPDSSPWIDRPDYWDKIKRFWRGLDVTMVLGTERSLRADMLTEAKSVRYVWGPRRDAYGVINRIQEEIGTPSGPIILCLGAAATVLAARLADKGLWAVDLGHIGMFMRSEGTFGIPPDELISKEYRQTQVTMHKRPGGYGGSGWKWGEEVAKFARDLDARVLLDYGCGEGTLRQWLGRHYPRLRVAEYDPGIEGKQRLPKLAELVVCTDVLEHVEPGRLDTVIKHIHGLATRGVYLNVATRPANKKLPNGKNAHLIIEDEDWWRNRVFAFDWTCVHQEWKTGHHLKLWLTKGDKEGSKSSLT
jgi:hypothetical protein